MLEKDVLPALALEPLEAITRADIGEIIQKIVARGSPIQANRTYEIVRRLYNWALGTGLVETTPCLGLKAPCSEKSRERSLSSEEIQRLWQQLPKAPMTWHVAQILRLCLVTAQRVGEVAGARKSEIHLSDRVWRLPGFRVKNGCAHNVPLSAFAIELFREAIARSAPDDDLIFGTHFTKRPITANAVSRAMNRSLGILGLDDVIPHDLRRTVATGMAKLGVTRLVVDKVLNHVSADRSTIAGVYDRHAYEEEKRQALGAWSSYVQSILDYSCYLDAAE
jgi:integrase